MSDVILVWPAFLGHPDDPTNGLLRYAERVWNTLSRQAVFDLTVKPLPKEKKALRCRVVDAFGKVARYDKDAIFKDPSWPHLWS